MHGGNAAARRNVTARTRPRGGGPGGGPGGGGVGNVSPLQKPPAEVEHADWTS